MSPAVRSPKKPTEINYELFLRAGVSQPIERRTRNLRGVCDGHIRAGL